jgi:hypothetical protein
VISILRDWTKGQVTAIETGILSFEAALPAPEAQKVVSITKA